MDHQGSPRCSSKWNSAWLDTGRKKVMGTREPGRAPGAQITHSAVKAPCSLGSGHGVVTENDKCKSISCCYQGNEEVVGKSGKWKVPRQHGFNGLTLGNSQNRFRIYFRGIADRTCLWTGCEK